MDGGVVPCLTELLLVVDVYRERGNYFSARLPMLQQMVLHPCTYRLHQIDSVDIKEKEST